MDALRRRAPFTFSEDTEPIDTRILDEQEQEEVITTLRKENLSSQRQHIVMTSILLVLSLLLQLVFVWTATNPLLAVFPPSSSASTSIPLPAFFTLIAVVVHLDMLRSLHPSKRGMMIKISGAEIPCLPLRFRYALATVAPTLSLFLARPWQVTVWWLFTPAVIFIVQTVQEAILHGTEMISELEAKKYVAPSA